MGKVFFNRFIFKPGENNLLINPSPAANLLKSIRFTRFVQFHIAYLTKVSQKKGISSICIYKHFSNCGFIMFINKIFCPIFLFINRLQLRRTLVQLINN